MCNSDGYYINGSGIDCTGLTTSFTTKRFTFGGTSFYAKRSSDSKTIYLKQVNSTSNPFNSYGAMYLGFR